MSSPFRLHDGHELEIGLYGPPGAPENAALECMGCFTVMDDADASSPAGALWAAHAAHGGVAVAGAGIDCRCGIRLAEAND